MRLKKKLLSFLLLGVFILPFAHDIVPHIHHSHNLYDNEVDLHQKNDNDHHHHDHDHEHDHSNDTQHGKQSVSHEKESLLSFLLNEHSHTNNHQHQDNVVLRQHKKTYKKKFKSSICALDVDLNLLENKTILSKDTFLEWKQFYDNPYLLYSSLRGPPLLG